MKAIQVRAYGGPEALELTELPAPEPGPGQVRLRVEAAGVNFIDVYHRTGRYPGALPFVPGNEGAGVVDAVGPGVTEFKVGDRGAWAMVRGGYAAQAVIPADRVVPVPAGVSSELACAVLLQGMTAHFLVHDCYPIRPGDTVLVHAGAGGVGLLLTQLAKARGARVLATVSSEEKAALARGAGAAEVIRYDQQDFEKEARRLTSGEGVACAYDSVGKDTFERSLRSLRRRGTLVLYGASSGAVPPFDPLALVQGSLYLTRPSLGDYVADRPSLLARASAVFEAVRSGALSVRIGGRYPLDQAAQAHRDLEGRKTTGKLLLLP